MLYVRPDYYDKFKCSANRCEATCCAGWQIVIDEGSLARYQSESRPYGEILRSRIDWEEGVFAQDCHKRCAFLKEDQLCDMYEQLGEESLCFTCSNYPRHIEEFENQREITLALSCPEVAGILLKQKDPVRFTEEEIEEDEEIFEDFDPFFFSYLEDARKIMLAILQNRKLSVAVRASLVQSMANEMQHILEEGDLFDLADVFEKYEEETSLSKAIAEAVQELNAFYDKEDYFLYAKDVFERLYGLEYLSDDWEAYLDQCHNTLFGAGVRSYQDIQVRFQEYCTKESFEDVSMEVILEQLLVYFVFTYFCGAVYDDNVAGKIRMSIDSVHIIYQMFAAKWTEQKGHISVKDMQRMSYRYSRELEHSDMNLEIMEG